MSNAEAKNGEPLARVDLIAVAAFAVATGYGTFHAVVERYWATKEHSVLLTIAYLGAATSALLAVLATYALGAVLRGRSLPGVARGITWALGLLLLPALLSAARIGKVLPLGLGLACIVVAALLVEGARPVMALATMPQSHWREADRGSSRRQGKRARERPRSRYLHPSRPQHRRCDLCVPDVEGDRDGAFSSVRIRRCGVGRRLVGHALSDRRVARIRPQRGDFRPAAPCRALPKSRRADACGRYRFCVRSARIADWTRSWTAAIHLAAAAIARVSPA